MCEVTVVSELLLLQEQTERYVRWCFLVAVFLFTVCEKRPSLHFAMCCVVVVRICEVGVNVAPVDEELSQ